MPAFGECVADGDQRRLAGGESLFDVQPITDKLRCSQLLQKELDTILKNAYHAHGRNFLTPNNLSPEDAVEVLWPSGSSF